MQTIQGKVKQKTVVLGITGSIAANKACDLVSLLREERYTVHVVMTEEAKQFVTPLTLQTLSGNPVFSDLFAQPPSQWNAIHIALAGEADLIVIAPATAAILGKLANGICDDLLTCVVTATQAPVMLAPAMNTQMYHHPAVQENLKVLRRFGYSIIEPEEGKLACGTEGIGHIASIEKIAGEIKKLIRTTHAQ